MVRTYTKSLLVLASLLSIAIAAPVRREVPQEHSHEPIIRGCNTQLQKNNPDKIVDAVFGLLGNAAAAGGQGNFPDTTCLQAGTADQAFTNAKADNDVAGMTTALIYRTLERNTGSVGLASDPCVNFTPVNPEVAALSQHQDPASPNAATINKDIVLELARQIASIGGDPNDALKSGTFAPGQIGDPTAKGNTCDDANDANGCIDTLNLRVDDATPEEIAAAVADGANGGNAGDAGATATTDAAGAGETGAANDQGNQGNNDNNNVDQGNAGNGNVDQGNAGNGKGGEGKGKGKENKGKGNAKGHHGKGKGNKNNAAEVTKTVTVTVTVTADGAAQTDAAGATDTAAPPDVTPPPADNGNVNNNAGDNAGDANAGANAGDANAGANAGDANAGGNAGGATTDNTASNGSVAPGSAPVNVGKKNFGDCTDPSVTFGAGLDGRKATEFSFIPNNQKEFPHGSALNPQIIFQFNCDNLVNQCGLTNADQQVKECRQAQADAAKFGKDPQAADFFNNALGFQSNFAGVNTAAPAAPAAGSAAPPAGSAATPPTDASGKPTFGKCKNPGVIFAAGLDGRKATELTFKPADLSQFNHGSAKNPDIIYQFICDQLVNNCGLKREDAAEKLCQDARTAAAALGPVGRSADTFNAKLGFKTNFAAVDNS